MLNIKTWRIRKPIKLNGYRKKLYYQDILNFVSVFSGHPVFLMPINSSTLQSTLLLFNQLFFSSINSSSLQSTLPIEVQF